MNLIKKQNHSYKDLSNCLRALSADAIEKAGSGHPGMVLGMADVMTVLCFEFLKYNPKDYKWFNRDRLVLSAGHGSMLLYSFYYLAGYKDFSLDDIKSFRQLGSKAAGHPEYGVYGAIETTTGPLAQGLGNAVGMSIAQKKYQAKLGPSICDYKIYSVVGDGCLMEGLSYEAASIAGHLNLNNLIILFDDNKVTIDGSTDLAVSEDHIAKFQSFGFNTESIDGHDYEQIQSALTRAQNSDKPYFIACRTTIAKGCPGKEASPSSHGAPLGSSYVKKLKEQLQMPQEEFVLPSNLIDIWRKAWEFNKKTYEEWTKDFALIPSFIKSYLDHPIIDTNFLQSIDKTTQGLSTRASSGKVISKLAAQEDKIIFGSADLSFSNNIKNDQSKAITRDDFSGNFLHYGVRESAMAAIMNGLAVSGFLPAGGTFFVFSDYMRPGIRLSAIMHNKVIYVMTHDSIGVGEDGPTHQPVEHLASMRAMPNLLVLRPADEIETLECWRIALENNSGPSMLVLTRQNVPLIRNSLALDTCSKGAYIIHKNSEEVDVTIFASGSEVHIAMEVSSILEKSGLLAMIVSVPCFDLFFAQPAEYINSIIGACDFKVAIEAGSSFGWHRIIGEKGLFFGLDSFGVSAPGPVAYEHFRLTPASIAAALLDVFAARSDLSSK